MAGIKTAAAAGKPGSHVTPGIAPDAPTNSAAAEPEKPKLTSAELRSLFDRYETEHAKVEQAEAVVETAAAARSEAVKAIVEAVGHKGPYKDSKTGALFTVSVRKNQTTGGTTYSFRKQSEVKTTL